MLLEDPESIQVVLFFDANMPVPTGYGRHFIHVAPKPNERILDGGTPRFYCRVHDLTVAEHWLGVIRAHWATVPCVFGLRRYILATRDKGFIGSASGKHEERTKGGIVSPVAPLTIVQPCNGTMGFFRSGVDAQQVTLEVLRIPCTAATRDELIRIVFDHATSLTV